MPSNVITSITTSLKGDIARLESEFDPGFQCLLSEADAIVKDRKELGQDAALELLKKVESSMRELISAENIMKANSSGLGAIAAEDGAEIDANELRTKFDADVKRRVDEQRKRGEAQFTSHAKYILLQRKRQKLTGGTSAEEEEMEEDLVMTQETIVNFKCPVLQMDMKADGEMRPMMSSKCGPMCRLSFKGAQQYLKGGKTKPCPSAGCNVSLKMSDLKDDKEMARKIRRAVEQIYGDSQPESSYVG